MDLEGYQFFQSSSFRAGDKDMCILYCSWTSRKGMYESGIILVVWHSEGKDCRSALYIVGNNNYYYWECD